MLKFSVWVFVDLLLLLFQLVLCLKFFIRQRPRFGAINVLGLTFSAFLFVAPVGLFPVGLSWVSERDSVVRDAFWHVKILGGLAPSDLLLMFVFGLLMAASRSILVKKRFLNIAIIPVVVFILGLASLINAPFDIDFKLVLNSTRTFVLIGFGALLAYRLGARADDSWIKPYLIFLIKINAISMISMLLLEYDAKAVRYWASSIIQSQGAGTVAIISMTFLLFSRLFFGQPWIRVAILVFTMLIAFGGAVKGVIFAVGLLLIGRTAIGLVYVRDLFVKLARSRLFLFTAVLLMPSAIILVNQISYGIDAIDTRNFQIVNSTQTLIQGGPLSSLFGIGWRQWYVEYFEFPFLDEGAWTEEEIYADGMKNSVQIIPYSLLRSIGLVGVVVALSFLWKTKGSQGRFENRLDTCRRFYLMYFLASELLAAPDILPEVALFASIMTFSLAFVNEKEAAMGSAGIGTARILA